MTQYSLEGTGPPETRPGPRPRPSRPLPFTLRIAEQPAPIAGAPALHSSQETADFIRPKIGAADREAFIILHLDPKNQLLDVELNGLGDVDSSAVYPRQVFKSALLRNASALIFCHNHPSGDPEPSLCDRQLTRDLVLGARAVGVKVLDHIIVGRDSVYFSFADQGLIDDYDLAASAAFPGQIREDSAEYVPQLGQAVRVKPGSSTPPQLNGHAGLVVAFVGGPGVDPPRPVDPCDRWPLVAFTHAHAFPSGITTHTGNGIADRPIDKEHRGRCWYLSPKDLEPLPSRVNEDPADYDDRDDDLIDGVGFADPGGRSALRAATRSNPRNLPCPTCGAKNRLTRIDRARGYQCDRCADRDEGRLD